MNKKEKENLHPLQFIWLWFGVKILGWKYIDIYSPDEDVIAMTFSMDEEYLDKVQKIELKKKYLTQKRNE